MTTSGSGRKAMGNGDDSDVIARMMMRWHACIL